MGKFTLNLDENNFILSISHTENDQAELDLSQVDLQYLNAYQYIDGTLILDEAKKQQIIEAEKAREETPTTEQRVDALETATDDIILMMAELIGGE